MKLTVLRAIPIVLAVDIAALFVSGVPRYKHAKHGFDFVISEFAWLGFLVGALAALVLAGTAVARLVTQRRTQQVNA